MIKVIENIDLNKDYLEFKLEGISKYALFSKEGLEESDGYTYKSDEDELDKKAFFDYYLETFSEKELEDYYNFLNKYLLSSSRIDDDCKYEDYDYDEEEIDEEYVSDKNENAEINDYILNLFYNIPYACFIDGIPYELYAIKDESRALVLYRQFDFKPFVGWLGDYYIQLNDEYDRYDDYLPLEALQSYNKFHECYALESSDNIIEYGFNYFKHWDGTINKYDSFLCIFFVSKFDNCMYRIDLSLNMLENGILEPQINQLLEVYRENSYTLEDFKRMLEEEKTDKPKVLKL